MPLFSSCYVLCIKRRGNEELQSDWTWKRGDGDRRVWPLRCRIWRQGYRGSKKQDLPTDWQRNSRAEDSERVKDRGKVKSSLLRFMYKKSKNGGKVTRREAGRLGRLSTYKRYGRGHMSYIGRRGFQATLSKNPYIFWRLKGFLQSYSRYKKEYKQR